MDEVASQELPSLHYVERVSLDRAAENASAALDVDRDATRGLRQEEDRDYRLPTGRDSPTAKAARERMALCRAQSFRGEPERRPALRQKVVAFRVRWAALAGRNGVGRQQADAGKLALLKLQLALQDERERQPAAPQELQALQPEAQPQGREQLVLQQWRVFPEQLV